jgi:predicted RNA-binding protein YlxR (DUF448 family)
VGKGKGHIPVRTCISCGAKGHKNELIRLILDGEGQVVRDDERKRHGRGAYVCQNKLCQEGLSKKKRLDRAFRGEKITRVSPALKLQPRA